MIKNQQLPEGEVERFLKESKALKTTVLVISAVLICLLPAVFFLTLKISGVDTTKNSVDMYLTWIRTTAMLNSFLNPLIYCRRRKEMRKFVQKLSPSCTSQSLRDYRCVSTYCCLDTDEGRGRITKKRPLFNGATTTLTWKQTPRRKI